MEGKVFASKERCEKVLKYLYLSKYLDEKMKKMVLQNKGTSFFLSNRGHELIGILTAIALDPIKDYSFPYYRDRAYVIALGASIFDLLASFLARESKHHSSGRMMPDHYSDNSLNIAPQSSCVGSQLLQAVGISKVFKGNEIAYVSAGNGATSQGDFHEALNFASLHKLNTLFVIQDNGFAISVPNDQQTAGSIAEISKGYANLLIIEVDGTSYLESSKAVDKAVKYLRDKKGPVLIIAKVVRLEPHSISDDHNLYKSKSCQDKERKLDPIILFEKYLHVNKILDSSEIQIIKENCFTHIEKEAKEAEKEAFPKKETVLDNLYKPFEIEENIKYISNEKITVMDAINHGILEEMEIDPNVIVFGEDVADNKGGVFKVTKGISTKFGEDRCFNSPLAESNIIGSAIGMCFDNKTKPVIEIQFADYVFSGFNQLVNELASIYYRSNGEFYCPIVIRLPYGGYIQGGPYHSQSIEATLAHFPGLKIVMPSTAEDYKMLLKTAIQDPNPVIFLEHKLLYRQITYAATKEPTKDSYLPFGKAKILSKGDSLTVVCYGMMAMFASEIAKKLKNEDINIEVIDLRTIVPLDKKTILESVQKTNKLLVLHEDKKFLGFGAEIVAIVQEEIFEYLDAPIKRVAALDIPIPYAKILEDEYFPQKEKIEKEIRNLHNF